MASYGRSQRWRNGGDPLGMIDFADPGVPRGHQHRSRPSRKRRIDVTADVADHEAVTRSDAQLAGGRSYKARLGFAAAAASVRSVRAHLPGVEGTQQRFHPGIDLREFVRVDQPAGDAGLVADHTDCDAVATELIQGASSARHGPDPLGVR